MVVENAGIQELCAEGRWEVAIGAFIGLDLTPRLPVNCLIPTRSDPESCKKHGRQYTYKQPLDAVARKVVGLKDSNTVEHRNNKSVPDSSAPFHVHISCLSPVASTRIGALMLS